MISRLEIIKRHKIVACGNRMSKITLEQLTQEDTRRLGTIYRNLNHFGFKKAMLSMADLKILRKCLGFHLDVSDTYIRPSEYITVMQAFYDLYRWGKYDEEDEIVWLLNKIKSEKFYKMLLNYEGQLNYLTILELIKVHGKECGLRLNVDTL